MSKLINLSISKQTIRRKIQGKSVTGFTVNSFDLEKASDVDSLEKMFKQNLYSNNVWGNPKPADADIGCTGSCLKENYLGMHGIVLDIDEPGMTIEQAIDAFRDYIYLIHTTSSHKVDKPDKGGVIDRFRIILPFEPNPDGSPYYENVADADRLYEFLTNKYPFADSATYERARKYYPFAGDDRSLYQFYFNADGNYISFAEKEIAAGTKRKPKMRLNPDRKKGNDFHIRCNVTTGESYYSPSGEEYLMPDEIIDAYVDGEWRDWTFQALKEKMLLDGLDKVTTFCNRCDDHDSQSPSAFIYVDFRGFFHMECTHCKSKGNNVSQYSWREYPISDAMFSQNKKIYEIRIKSAEHIGPHEVSREEWKNNDEANFAIQTIKKRKFFLSSNFTINYYSDPSMISSVPEYHLCFQQNKIDIAYPVIDTVIDDNAFVDAYLDDVFGKYSSFIKDWLALYVYSNYISLPVLVLVGGRGSGKNTFVQMVGDIYPMLWAQWTGDRERFNSYYTKKLLWIDENSFGDKRSQYDEIKYLTGNQYITVEEKYLPRYRVQNNIKVILTTNDFRPLAVKNEEAPTSEKDNNFFFYEFKPVDPDKRDRTLGQKLCERIGYYCRTELKRRYDDVLANADNKCRYMIPCPITEYSDKVYVMAMTDVDLSIEDLIPMLSNRCNRHIKYGELRQLLKDEGIVTNNTNVKHYLTALQHKKILSYEETRKNSQRLGYEILVFNNNRVINYPFDDYDDSTMVDEDLYSDLIAKE